MWRTAAGSTLRVVLQDALARSRELINALKRQKKQSKTVQTALASLRQLQDLPA
ncbi:MAG: hypothetical protein O3A00_18195 [Planctomycetota bacterium]|nr:hypothetical protein [Planctomycetota bacterium]